jgi:hypothetical protein
MKINSLNKEYIQKSRLFLYPQLKIRRGISVTPIQTFMNWNHYDCTHSRLICQYYLRDDNDFKMFESVKLFGHPLFEDFYELEDGTGVYIFNVENEHRDFELVVKGQYSKLSVQAKKNIINFFKGNTQHYIESYLYPEKYYGMYSEILNVDLEHLKAAGELCSKPDLDKERLDLEIKIMNINNNNVNLNQ